MSRRVKRPLAKRASGDRPKGARPYRGSAGRAAAGSSPRRQAACAFCVVGAARGEAGAFHRRAREGRRRAAAAADKSPDRHRDGGRSQHARRSLSRGAVSRPVVLPYPAHRPQRRVARERQARRQQGSPGRRAKRPHSAAKTRRAEGRGKFFGSREENARRAEGHDPVRGRRRDGAEQAGGSCRAGRLRHHAACRPDAGDHARRQGAAPAAGAPARPRDLGMPAGRQDPLCRDGVDRLVPPSLRAKNLLGAGRRRAEAEAGPHLDLSCQGRERGRFDHARGRAWRRGRQPCRDLLCGGGNLRDQACMGVA